MTPLRDSFPARQRRALRALRATSRSGSDCGPRESAGRGVNATRVMPPPLVAAATPTPTTEVERLLPLLSASRKRSLRRRARRSHDLAACAELERGRTAASRKHGGQKESVGDATTDGSRSFDEKTFSIPRQHLVVARRLCHRDRAERWTESARKREERTHCASAAV